MYNYLYLLLGDSVEAYLDNKIIALIFFRKLFPKFSLDLMKMLIHLCEVRKYKFLLKSIFVILILQYKTHHTFNVIFNIIHSTSYKQKSVKRQYSDLI